MVGTSKTYNRTMLSKDFELQVKVTSDDVDVYDTQYVNDSNALKPTANETVQTIRIPEAFALKQNYPNPFNPSTEIRFEVPQASHVTLNIFNVAGQKIRTLVDQRKEAGYHTLAWDAKDDAGHAVASGVYIYRLDAQPANANEKSFSALRKMMLLH